MAETPKHRTAPTPGEWKLIDMPETWDIASQENRNSFGVFARIDKNEIFPGQARANALCMLKAKKALNLLKHIREQFSDDGHPVNFSDNRHPIAKEIDALLADFEKEGIFI